MRDAGFAGPEQVRLPTGGVLAPEADDLVAWVYSLSDSVPHLFGARRSDVESDLHAVLREASPSGFCSEQPPDTEMFVWRSPRSTAQGGQALRVPIALDESPDR